MHRCRNRGFTLGFTLVEVLVALCVLAIGALGAAATQVGNLRLRQQAALESEAVQLAASLGARMRVNPAQLALDDAANPYLGLDYDASAGAPAPPPASCFGAAGCSAAQMARFDLYEAMRAVQAAFPGGRIVVCRDSAPWDATRAALAWPCSTEAGAPVVVKLGWRARTDAAMPFVALAVAP